MSLPFVLSLACATSGGNSAADPGGAPPPTEETAPEGPGACEVGDPDEGAREVVNEAEGWILLAPEQIEVRCEDEGNFITTDFGFFISVVATPLMDPADARRNHSAGFAEVMEKRFGTALPFHPRKVGDADREALCASEAVDVDGTPAQFIACVTAHDNGEGALLIHTVGMTVTRDEYDPQPDEVEGIVNDYASGWMLLSDFDEEGNLVGAW